MPDPEKPSGSPLNPLSQLVGIPANLAQLVRALEFTSLWRWAGLSILVGAFVGGVACLYYWALEQAETLLMFRLAQFDPPLPGGESNLHVVGGDGIPGRPWVFIVLPALGGLVSGLLIWKLAPEAKGHGTDAMIDAYHTRDAKIPVRVPVVTALASIFTIGSGGSAGREGPTSQIGAGFGSWLSTVLKLSARERRLLLLAGAAAGISALFRTPLGAALWALEVLYREDFEAEGMFPCLVSSVTAYSIFITFFGQGHLFITEADYLFRPAQLPIYALMAIGLALFGLIWIKVFYGTEHAFEGLKLPSWVKPVLGGLLLGGIGFFMPKVLGIGYGWVQETLRPDMGTRGYLDTGWAGAGLLLGIAAGKMLATSLTVGSGGSGGVFAPSIVIGGLLGGAFGLAANQIFPDVVPQPGAFVLVGMGAFYAGVSHTPIASLVLVCELCGSYDLLVPLMVAIMVTYLLLRRHTLYEKQVRTPLESGAHTGEFVVDVLEELKVREVYKRQPDLKPIPMDMRLRDFLSHVSMATEWLFPVSDANGKLRGMISLADVRGVVADPFALDVVIVGDAMAPLRTVSPATSLRGALQTFMKTGASMLPVVDPEAPNTVLGLLSQQDIIAAYNAEMLRRRVGAPESARVSRELTIPPRPPTGAS